MRALVVVVALAAWGCSSDPCGGQKGACISAHIVGNASGLDQLAVTVDKPTSESVRTPTPPASFTLPVNVGLALRSGATGTVKVAIDGLARGVVVAHTSMLVVLPASGHAAVTFTLNAGTASSDMAVTNGDGGGSDGGSDAGNDGGTIAGDGFMAPDMACAGVYQCKGGDGCCPVGCVTATDSDCKPAVCGNSIVENGEACDDGNVTNGDGCDPTCHYTLKVDTLAGLPHGSGHADGSGATVRFGGISGLANAGNDGYFISDSAARAIRRVDAAGQVTTYVGFSPNNPTPPQNGPFVNATFRSPGSMTVSNGGALWVVDDSFMREIDTVNLSVATPFSLQTNAASLDALAYDSDDNFVLIAGDAGNVEYFVPPATTLTALPGASTANTLGGGPCSSIAYFKDAGNVKHFYVACGKAIIDIANGSASLFAGSMTAGCASSTRALSTFTDPHNLAVQTTMNPPTLFISDRGCGSVRQIALSGANTDSVTQFAGCSNVFGCGAAPMTTNDMAHFTSISALLADPVRPALLAADTGLLILPPTGGVSTFAGLWPAASTTAPSNTADGQISLSTISSGMVGDGTRIYFGDHFSGGIFGISFSSGGMQLVPSSTFNASPNAQSIALTRIGATLYAAGLDGTIHSIGTNGGNPTLYAGVTRAVGTPGSSMDGPRLAAVITPTALATDGTNVYFLDGAKTIRGIDAVSGMVSTIAGSQGSTDIKNGTGTLAHFANPTGLTCDGTYLYTLDGAGAPTGTVIRRIKIATGEVGSFAGDAMLAGSVDSVGPAARFAGATDLASDGIVLFVLDPGLGFHAVDRNGPTIREVDLATASVTTAIGTVGQWSTTNSTGLDALVNNPIAITFDPVAHRIVYWDAADHVFQRMR